MDSERAGSLRKVLLVSGHGFLDVELFKLAESFGEQNLAVQHLVDQGFKSCAHLDIACDLLEILAGQEAVGFHISRCGCSYDVCG